MQICLKEVISKLSDNNTRIREKSVEVVLLMGRHPLIGAYTVLGSLSKPVPAQTCKPAVWTARLSCCEKVLKDLRFSSTSSVSRNDASLRSCTNFAAQGYHNTKEDVRLAAYLLLLELYRALGKPDLTEQLNTQSFRKA